MRSFCGFFIFTGALLAAGLSCLGAPAPEGSDDIASYAKGEPANSEFIVARWTSGDGLPANEIQDIRETPEGYLWLGSYQGLIRFDGVRFQSFYTAPAGLRYGTRIEPLEVDALGRLWFAPDETGLVYLEGGGFHEVLTNGDTLSARVEQLCADGTNGIWWVDSGGGLGHIKGGAGLKAEALKERSTAGARWMRGYDKNLWLAGLRRVRYLRDGQFHEVAVPGNAALMATPHREGGLWVAREARLRRVNTDGQVRDIGLFPWAGVSRVQCMLEDSRNCLWIGTVGQGLYCYTKGRFQQVVSSPDSITCVFEDSSGSIWAGSRGGGLLRIRKRKFFQQGIAGGLHNDFVRSLAQDTEGRMWLATGEGGLGWFREGEWHQLGPAEGWSARDALSVCPSRKGGVLISTVRRGLWRWKDGQFTRQQFRGHAPREPVADLLEDRQGRIWMVTDNTGIFCLAGHSITNYTMQNGLPSGLIRCVLEDEDGAIWAGDWEGAIAKFSEHHWEIVRKADGHRDAVRAMVATGKTLWIGTSAGGLLRLKDGNVSRLTSDEGLPDNSIRQLIIDQRGALWGTTPHKLFRVPLEQLNAAADAPAGRIDPVVYGRGEGLPEVSFASWSDPRCWRTEEGEVWLATANGAVHFQPAALPERKVPQVLVQETILDGRLASPAELQNLRPGAHVLKFIFTAPCLSAPERVRFRYQFSGVNEGWVEAGTDRTATYASLPAGHHEFRVIACSPDGVWGTQVAAVGIAVHPFFWQTKWFLALAVALIAGGGALFIRRATVRRLRRRVEELHRQHEMERERARIARDIHDELGASLTSIGLLADIGRKHQQDPVAVAKDFNQISQTARESVIAMDAIVWAVNPRNDSLDHFANYIAQFSREFFGLTQVRTRLDLPADLPAAPLPAETRHQLFLIVKEAFNNIVRHASASEVRLQLLCEADNLVLIISDNGKGMPSSQLPGSAGNGIGNMRERIGRLGGKMVLTPVPGQGVKLEFRLPLPRPALN